MNAVKEGRGELLAWGEGFLQLGGQRGSGKREYLLQRWQLHKDVGEGHSKKEELSFGTESGVAGVQGPVWLQHLSTETGTQDKVR